MKNFQVQVNNKEYWISRSVAVCGMIFVRDSGIRVLANKRGIGCPDEIGKWNCPCGYVDYDETLKEACAREIREETNLKIDSSLLKFYQLDDNPKNPHQNISITFWDFNDKYAGQTVYAAGSEINEVADVEWINIEELDKYEWAFNHEYLIMKIALEKFPQILSEAIKRRFSKKLLENNYLFIHAKS